MADVDIAIDELNLRLPPQFAPHADAIARAAVGQLRVSANAGSMRVRQLDIPPVAVSGGETKALIARKIAKAISTSLGHATENAGGGQHAAD